MPRFGLESVILLLLVLWVAGAFVASPPADLIHLLLVAAGMLVVARVVQWRRTPGRRRGRSGW
jgi:uncharacterized protein involved in response to NO